MGWEASGANSKTTPVVPSWDTTPDLHDKLDERVMTRIWNTALERGWKEAQSCLSTELKRSFAEVVRRRDFNVFGHVYGKPPERHVHTAGGVVIVLPSGDYRYEDLPPDPLIAAGTDVSQVLGVPYMFVDTEVQVKSMLDALPTFGANVPLLSIDLEGFNLGRRKGNAYLLQIYDSHSHRLYIVDLCKLREDAFSILASDGETSLKAILENGDILKLFCDVRGDAYALYKEFKIILRGIEDVQNLHLASRRHPTTRQWRTGLATLIDQYAGLSAAERTWALAHKESGRQICRDYGLIQFGVRPLRGDLAVYAGNNVLHLYRIYDNLVAGMTVERLESADFRTLVSIFVRTRSDYDPDEASDNAATVDWRFEYADDDSQATTDH
jgi:3'-5' exonuclease